MYRHWLLIAVLSAAGAAGNAQSTEPGIGIGDTTTQKWSFEDAQALAAKGRLNQALVALDQLATQTPVPAGVERLRGMIFYQKDQLAEAVDAFKKASEQDANDRASVEMEGVSLFRLGRAPEALPFLERARLEKVENANVEPEYVLGLCYSDVARYDDARHAFATQYGFGARFGGGVSARGPLVSAPGASRRGFKGSKKGSGAESEYAAGP